MKGLNFSVKLIVSMVRKAGSLREANNYEEKKSRNWERLFLEIINQQRFGKV
jgi:hypothetical protein